MVDWYGTLAARAELPADAAAELLDRGFVVLPDVVTADRVERLSAANVSDTPRRSLHGAFIPRDGRSATDFAARVQPATLARLSSLARYVLAI